MLSDDNTLDEKISEVIKYFRGHNVQLLTSMDFGFVDTIARKAEQKETNKGRKKI